MRLNNKEAALLNRVIEAWEDQELLDKAKADQLKASYQSDAGDYKTLTFYAFFAAISCALLAFGALVLDEKWIERMRSYFSFSEFTIAALFAGLSFFLVWYIRKRKKKYLNAIWANESLSILLALSTCIAITYFGKALSQNSEGYYWLILAAGAFFAIEAFFVRSNLLWACMIAAIVGWWASFTFEMSEPFFWGMNMPVRLFVLSLVLLGIHYAICRRAWLQSFVSVNYFAVWVMFFTTAWGVSVFGNFDLDQWFSMRQARVLGWAVAYTIILAGLLYYAIKAKDKSLRDMVLLFLILNLYTRYFEYFWDVTNKGIFFAILALSFWLIGKKLEQIRKRLDKAAGISE
ncbi:MAG: hypothetical protein BGO31_14780 [Bacteroidetes bacterium 43-16]|nr:MAG: hypothetical protein BGO31_14780 [Bacteroidetes bacterium 43-16]